MALILLLLAAFPGASAVAAPGLPQPPGALLRFNFNNDIFFRKDDKITAGWTLQAQSAVQRQWSEQSRLPDFLKQWAQSTSFLSAPSLSKRIGIGLGQTLQTPKDLSQKARIPDDVPYAAVLALTLSLYAYDDETFNGVELVSGVVGPASLGEQSQRFVHRILNNEDPQGWANQLPSEWIINLNLMKKIKLLQLHNTFGDYDLALNANGGIGNLYTQLSLSVETRFGRNIPRGFLYVADPVGFSMNYKAQLQSPDHHSPALYGSLVLRSSYLRRRLFLDGTYFHHSVSVARQPWVGQAILGLHYENADWALHFTLLRSTQDVDTSKLPLADRSEAIGTLAFEWRYQ